MLKIKDNVDLKILEKYGFEYHKLIYVKEIPRGYDDLIEDKKIYIEENSRDISLGIGIFNTDIELDTIFDLIQDGLVEKV